METAATIVLDFGPDIDTSLVIAEFDDFANGVDGGSFTLEQGQVYVLIQLDPSLAIESVKCSDGSINYANNVNRDKSDIQVVLTETTPDTTLTYLPAGDVDTKFYGNVSELTYNSRAVTGSDVLPAIVDFTYTADFIQYVLTPPDFTQFSTDKFTDESVYPIAIVFKIVEL